jgi:hypothetical protein
MRNLRLIVGTSRLTDRVMATKPCRFATNRDAIVAFATRTAIIRPARNGAASTVREQFPTISWHSVQFELGLNPAATKEAVGQSGLARQR